MTVPDPRGRLSLNHATIPGWTVPEAADGCARTGLGWLGLWRNRVAETGLERCRRALRDAGVGASSLCRAGWFLVPEEGGASDRRGDNLRAIEEAAALGAQTLVLVCGPAPTRDLDAGRQAIGEAIAELAAAASGTGVRLAVEPMHPMYCADRSAVVTLDHALDLAEAAGDGTGVIVDTYHVWWDPRAESLIERAGASVLGFHVADWLVDTPDMLEGRGMIGDGVIDFHRLRGAVDRAGYAGPIEVEIFNPEVWALDGDEALRLIIDRCAEYVL
jgi:sugar phosphate isomerase/epimerase